MKITTEEFETKIHKNWPTEAALFYFAQILSGACTVEETINDLLSLEKPTQAGEGG